MLSLAEHEICPANKSQTSNNSKFFLAKNIFLFFFLSFFYTALRPRGHSRQGRTSSENRQKINLKWEK